MVQICVMIMRIVLIINCAFGEACLGNTFVLIVCDSTNATLHMTIMYILANLPVCPTSIPYIYMKHMYAHVYITGTIFPLITCSDMQKDDRLYLLIQVCQRMKSVQ